RSLRSARRSGSRKARPTTSTTAPDSKRARRRRRGYPSPVSAPRILSVGTKTPATRYTQEELLDRYGSTEPMIRSLFLQSHISTRYLTLPPLGDDGNPRSETQG